MKLLKPKSHSTGVVLKDPIMGFRGNYFFLSNFYEVPVTFMGYTFRNSEAAFQSCKDTERRADFVGLTGAEAKKLGKRVTLRPDWDIIKYRIMYEVCREKFIQNHALLVKLRDTGDRELVETNTWGDTYWGTCDDYGENNLGQILMRIRRENRVEVSRPPFKRR